MRLSKKIKEQFVTALEVPRDLAYQETIVTITGPCHVVIDNYRSIQKISKEEIIVLCIHGKIHLIGKRLEIQHYTPDEMLITGCVTEIKMKR